MKRHEQDYLSADVRELVVVKEHDAYYKDLDHEDEHTEQDIRLVVDVEVGRDADHNHCFLRDEDNDMSEDMVAVGKMDDCST